jgi:hypothetical protein
MRDMYRRLNRYRLTRPPKALRSAKLDNIAIVPASMLPLKGTIQPLLNNLPHGAVFLCHVAENVKQKRVLERAGEVFKQHGHAVTNMPMEHVL